ncbi:prenyltransferase/squalene oxidase repeat-containing protein [Nitrospira sp. Nam80]
MNRTASHIDLKPLLHEIIQRAVTGGGFSDRAGGSYRSDATAWAILALDLSKVDERLLNRAQSRLASEQQEDGRVSISPHHVEASWPTSLAILAWQDSSTHDESSRRAVRFLLEHEGHHWKKSSDDPLGHDTALKGWPWIEGTHSWVEPTALSVLALVASGHTDHVRVQGAIRLILDRQLPRGGWNYGNTTVFGQELHPAPESTGAALTALAQQVPVSAIQRSLDYLNQQINQLRTPIAVGWALLGLQAWGLWPPNGYLLVERCLQMQVRYGPYDTASLSLVLLPALKARRFS